MTQQPPPPGWQPGPPPGQGFGQGPWQPAGQAAWAPQGQGPWQQGWAPVGPPPDRPPQPGIVPLRPLRIGDLYDGAVKAIRQNPRTMIGLALLLQTVFVLVPALVTAVLALTGAVDLSSGTSSPFTGSASSSSGALGASLFNATTGAKYAGQLFSALATLVLVGIVSQVVRAAVLGRRTAPGEAWAAVRGRLLPLVGLVLLSALLTYVPLLVVGAVLVVGFLTVGSGQGGVLAVLVLLSVVAVLAYLAYLLWVLTRLHFATAALVLEGKGPVAAMRRSFDLTRGAFWRILGIWLLTGLLVGIAASVLTVPLGLLSGLAPVLVSDSTVAGAVSVGATYLSTLLASALTTPFSAGVTLLQYFDQRIRREGYDVELLAQLES